MSRCKRKVSLIEVVVVALIVAIVCLVLSPVIATSTGGSALVQCQANMRKIGSAVKMYLADWDRMYMTNRLSTELDLTRYPYPRREVGLADPTVSPDSTSGMPSRFLVTGTATHISWVGALYRYIEAVTNKDDASSVWKCPAASSAQAGTAAVGGINTRTTAYVTYIINYNLLERPNSVIRYASTLMMCREMDRLVASVCRAFKSGGVAMGQPVTGSGDTPASPFLTTVDQVFSINGIQTKLHGNGSNILFADGHVKAFSAASYPSSGVPVWDTTLGTWGNVSPNPTVTLMP